jgi:hypothetical protein
MLVTSLCLPSWFAEATEETDRREMQDSEPTDGPPAETSAEARTDDSTALSAVSRRRHRRSSGTTLTVVDGRPDPDLDAELLGELAHKLAVALRAVRGHVPDHIWWDTGAADALIEYQARYRR